MESGVIPPPKRASRSLVAPPKVLSKEHYMPPKLSGSAANVSQSMQNSASSQISDPKAFEDDQRRLQLTLREEQRKVDQLLRHQTQLEEELVRRSEMAEKALSELKQLKQKRQNTESDLAQTSADFMNCQAKWLQQAEEFSEEIQLLKMKLSTAQKTLENQAKEAAARQEQENLAKRNQKPLESKQPSDSVQKAEQIEFQSRVYVEEAKQLNAKLKRELAEQRSINDRLIASNEEYKDTIDQYQFLLIEKTVMGDLNPPVGLMSDELTNLCSPLTTTSSPRKDDSFGKPDDTLSEFSRETAPSIASSDAADETCHELGGKIGEEANNLTETEVANATSGDKSDAKHPLSNSEELAAIKQRLHHQDFELKALQNHNRALTVSLENLVGRLLENQGFHRIVNETLPPGMVQNFCARVSNQLSRPNSVSSATKIMFEPLSAGGSSKRVFSLGIDNELPPPHPRPESVSPCRNNLDIVPLRRQGTSASTSPNSSEFDPKSLHPTLTNSDHHRRSASAVSTDQRPASSSPNHKLGGSTNTRNSAGNPVSGGDISYASSENDFRKAPRVESMSGLRKLRLKD